MLDYETLRLIWWLLLGVMLIGFAIMDGFDLGSAFLLPIVGRTARERRGVTMGNLLLGGPFRCGASTRGSFECGFFELLSRFGLLCGLLSLAIIAARGAGWMRVKPDGPVQARARQAAMIAAAAALLLFAV